ncbi:unnamed protein product [Symbiodinium natans]|uniref:Uncharacterized protein n=1 Tax=Symbiodinium natans TaxID=878477 RepID=A0A812R5S3_9DINO|nr:unnamed protein product [Symbiodinium natans]
MAAQGDFLLRSDGRQERKVFLIRGTDLEIGGESISSEWTTDSEAERAAQKDWESRGHQEVPWLLERASPICRQARHAESSCCMCTCRETHRPMLM